VAGLRDVARSARDAMWAAARFRVRGTVEPLRSLTIFFSGHVRLGIGVACYPQWGSVRLDEIERLSTTSGLGEGRPTDRCGTREGAEAGAHLVRAAGAHAPVAITVPTVRSIGNSLRSSVGSCPVKRANLG